MASVLMRTDHEEAWLKLQTAELALIEPNAPDFHGNWITGSQVR